MLQNEQSFIAEPYFVLQVNVCPICTIRSVTYWEIASPLKNHWDDLATLIWGVKNLNDYKCNKAALKFATDGVGERHNQPGCAEDTSW